MSYMTDVTNSLCRTLEKAVTLLPHQFAGYAANLNFWQSEVAHCMVLLNGYYDRFKTIQAAEEDYKNRHPSSESQSYESGKPRAAGLPLRRGVKNSELVELKLRLETAFDRLVRRCVEEQMISPAAAQTMLREFHRSTDP